MSKTHRKTRTKEHSSEVLGAIAVKKMMKKVKDETCLMAQASNEICLGVDLEPDEWIKDSGCSKHMTGNRKLFSSYKAYNGGNVIFGSNLRGNIIGKEPKNVNEALTDDSWIVAMQEELNQFIANDVWELVLQPRNMTIIGTKWVFRNKLYENDIVSRNKARLVAQGYNQQEGIDYDETYALVARLESIRILLAYACALDFKLFQMDVKSAFLNGFINEEVYVAQPPGFTDSEKPDHVYKLKKALYGLKQAPKAWNDGTHFINRISLWKWISDKRTKNQAKTDKTEHGMEKREKSKSKSTPTNVKDQSQSRNQRNEKWAHPYPSNGPGQPI
ncbi:retrovirus-related pol polyprotein from transposon TNT 1-94 [Tanacetum coccineum]